MKPASHEDIQELLGAYALDAVDDDERDVVDDHLTTCPRCRAEVADHRETAALLAFAGQDAPAGVWDAIAASLEEPPPPLTMPLAPKAPPSRRVKAWWSGGLVAAAAVVISLLALTITLRGNGDGGRFEIPDGPRVQLTSADGRHSADMVMANGRGYVVNDNLPKLSPDEVYQLWGRKGTELISLGLLGTDPDNEEFIAGEQFDAYAITVEKAGGVVSSTAIPVVSGQV
ncbi:MAG TPA: anti-sigma factor [Acidimicrobiales bacterium]|nr:anti-sigma factor [Acidimicrobiales bacterium]